MTLAHSAFIALRHRNFRLLWTSQLVSMAGSMMQNAVILWHVSLLVPAEQRGLALGMVGLVKVVPIVGFSVVSGVVADAVDRRRLMLVTQIGMALCAAALALIAFGGTRTLWPLYLLAALSSAGYGPPPSASSVRGCLAPRPTMGRTSSPSSRNFHSSPSPRSSRTGCRPASRPCGHAEAYDFRDCFSNQRGRSSR